MTIDICSGSYRIQVNPREGGQIENFIFCGGGKDLAILKPKPSQNHKQDGIPLYGSFAMIPFCNRLVPSNIMTSEGEFSLPKNWANEDCSIHGIGLSEEWEVVVKTQDSCRLSTSLYTLEGRCVGIGIQELKVSETGGLTSRLGYFNNQFDWIMAGLGFHPWFYLNNGDADFEFVADGKFKTDERLLPTSYHKLAWKEVRINTQQNNEIDTCFAGWEGRSILFLKHCGVELELSSNATNLHVYINKNLDAICIEPVTHITNAMHDPRWNSYAGMKQVNQGEFIWLDMAIRVLNQPTQAFD